MNIKIIVFIAMLITIVGCRGRRHTSIDNNSDDNAIISWGGAEVNEDGDDSESPEETPLGAKPSNVKVALPLNYISITSEYGPREDPLTGKQTTHNGLDLSASGDTAVAMMPGVVADVGKNTAAGNFVALKHGELMVTYCHLSKVLTKKGNIVVAGSLVGITGETGRTTGEHLHLTCKFRGSYIDPEIILDIINSQMSATGKSDNEDS